jgi:CheY-like chemotaxis protein
MVFRILHVDDDPDVREIVKYVLERESDIAVTSMDDAQVALTAATGLRPDLILCDAMMPVLDGPAFLARLRLHESTATTPVVFLIAGSRNDELARFKKLGVAGIIVKPLDPTRLAAMIRGHISSGRPHPIAHNFLPRLQADELALGALGESLRRNPDSPALLADLQSVVHKLAGASGILGYRAVSTAATAVEDLMLARCRDGLAPQSTDVQETELRLAALIECIDRELDSAGASAARQSSRESEGVEEFSARPGICTA